MESLKGMAQADDVHRAFLAGYDRGFAEGQRFASEDMAREWLHALARDYTDMAVRTATANHGPGWASEIEAQAVGS